jgi:thiosulfate/3-mercaptopyruvate sulfurtransferase
VVVVYDRQGGMYAARAWWVIRWMGHAHVALLDGGLTAWQAEGGETSTDAPTPRATSAYPAQEPALPTFDTQQLQSQLDRVLIIDARAPERYRGETEPLDAVAGHIPGARNRFFKDNLQADGRFKSAERLRTEYDSLLNGRAVVQQCGSGVTACHNLLAMEVAGFGTTALYPGSWSEWSSDAARPMVRGPAKA